MKIPNNVFLVLVLSVSAYCIMRCITIAHGWYTDIHSYYTFKKKERHQKSLESVKSFYSRGNDTHESSNTPFIGKKQ